MSELCAPITFTRAEAAELIAAGLGAVVSLEAGLHRRPGNPQEEIALLYSVLRKVRASMMPALHPPEALEALRAENATLKDALHRDQTGLAQALADVQKIAAGYAWICEGRGPYRYDDGRYRQETAHLISDVTLRAGRALRESGNRAHALCCPARHPLSQEALPHE